MTNLSSAACAVLNASKGAKYDNQLVADILKAAADQVVPFAEITSQEDLESRREAMVWGMQQQTQLIRQQFLAIAAELEAESSLFSINANYRESK